MSVKRSPGSRHRLTGALAGAAGSLALVISRSANYKFPMAYTFVLKRKDIKAILSVIIPLYVLTAFPPLCQVFNNSSLNDSGSYLATLMLALIAHRSVIDERTKLAVGLSRYDNLFFLAMFCIVIQVVILSVVREINHSYAEESDGDGVGAGTTKRTRREGTESISDLQMHVMMIEYGFLFVFFLTDAIPMAIYIFGARHGARMSTAFQVAHKHYLADFVMNTADIVGSEEDDDPILLSNVYAQHMTEWRRLRANKVVITYAGAQHHLDIQLKSYLSLLIKARDNAKPPRDVLRSRLIFDGLNKDHMAAVKAIEIEGYELVEVVVKDIEDLSEHYTVSDDAAPTLHRPAQVIFNLRFQCKACTALWIELQLLDAPVPELQHLVYKLVTYQEGISEMSLLVRATAVAYSLWTHLCHFTLTCRAIAAEWYAFTRYNTYSNKALMKRKKKRGSSSALDKSRKSYQKSYKHLELYMA